MSSAAREKTMLNEKQVIDEIRHSAAALRGLPTEIQLAARHVYYDAIRMALLVSTLCAACSFLASFVANGEGLARDCERKAPEPKLGDRKQADARAAENAA
jgi:hypothetical protein